MLPDGKVFMVANNQSIIYDIETGDERILPDIPTGVRVTNPFDGSAILLPLSPPHFTPEVLVCGGTNITDTTPPGEISSQTPATDQCSRIVLTEQGIKRGWIVERMLEGRIMPELVHLPNGQVLIVNGGRTGVAAIATTKDPVGNSNADHPVFTPSLYTPDAPLGRRISNIGMPASNIGRMYHSTYVITIFTLEVDVISDYLFAVLHSLLKVTSLSLGIIPIIGRCWMDRFIQTANSV